MSCVIEELKIKGLYEDGFYQFKGIPYGKAERFMPPVEASWDGILDCIKFSIKAPQIKNGEVLENGEDCLTLNVYTKGLEGNKPVFVYIHGGAFQTGHNQGLNPLTVIGEDDFVLVCVQYRLGVLGYLYQEAYPTSGNNGTLDQMLALEWISKNIHYFGGDKNRITVGGESAGAKAIGALMGTKANQLFSSVLLCSGANQSVRSIETAKKVTEKMAALVDVSTLKDMPLKELMNYQKELCKGNSTCMFGPVSDGLVISKDFYDFDHYFTGKALISSCLHELAYYPMMDKDFLKHAEMIAKELFGKNSEVAKAEAMRLGNDENAWEKVLSDGMYRTYSYRLAKFLKSRGQDVYVCSFTYAPALHVFDFQLAFNPKGCINFCENKEEALALGKKIRRLYVDFILNGHVDIPCDMQMTWAKESKLEPLDEAYCDGFPKAIYVL